MKPSKKFLSLPIVTLSEGQHIGYVKSLVIDSQSKSLAALVIDPKGFFKDQRIIPYAKVVSVGDDAITIDKGVHVEKSTSLPEILTLIKEKLTVIGTRVITQSGKTLGVVEEYFVEPETGKITQLEISGGKIEGFLNGKALLDADYITTIGQDVIVTAKGCESTLIAAEKGLNDAFKSIIHSTSNFASGTTQALGKALKREKKNKAKDTSVADLNALSDSWIDEEEASETGLDHALAPASDSDIAQESNEEITVALQDMQAAAANDEATEKVPSTKEPLG